MKIIGLQVENFQRIKAASITPTDNMVVISGANEQGKTSIINAIWWALGGADMTKATKTVKPIRDGADCAEVVVNLGDMIVTKRATAEGNTYLSVENNNGLVYKSPQKLLDGLIGKIAFDPLSFAQMDEKKQKETLLDLLKIGNDIEEIDKQRKAVYEARTEVNATIKSLDGQFNGLPCEEPDAPEEEINSAAILAELEKANEENRKNDRLRLALKDLRAQVGQAETLRKSTAEEISQLEDRLRATRAKLDEIEADGERLAARVKQGEEVTAKLVDHDISSFQARLAAVEETNRKVRTNRQGRDLADSLNKFTETSDRMTKEIASLDTKKTDIIKGAQYPIEHLGFDDSGVTYKGIPFAQCSAAERLRVSLAMAMAMNPRLRVLRITDGSLIDSKNMAVIQEMCKEKDYQAWVEKVDESGKLGIYIEDGEIKTPPPAEKE